MTIAILLLNIDKQGADHLSPVGIRKKGGKCISYTHLHKLS